MSQQLAAMRSRGVRPGEGGGPRVLIVEDDPADVAMALRALERTRLPSDEVRVARDGVEALEMLGLGVGKGEAAPEPLPQVIFLDLRMPRIDGWEVLREIRAAERTRLIPVVVVSSSDREEDVRSCYQLGANGFLVKRFDASRPGGYWEDAARYWLQLNRAPAASEEWTS